MGTRRLFRPLPSALSSLPARAGEAEAGVCPGRRAALVDSGSSRGEQGPHGPADDKDWPLPSRAGQSRAAAG